MDTEHLNAARQSLPSTRFVAHMEAEQQLLQSLFSSEQLAFCSNLPKCELHAHLNGSIPDEIIRSATFCAATEEMPFCLICSQPLQGAGTSSETEPRGLQAPRQRWLPGRKQWYSEHVSCRSNA